MDAHFHLIIGLCKLTSNKVKEQLHPFLYMPFYTFKQSKRKRLKIAESLVGKLLESLPGKLCKDEMEN